MASKELRKPHNHHLQGAFNWTRLALSSVDKTVYLKDLAINCKDTHRDRVGDRDIARGSYLIQSPSYPYSDRRPFYGNQLEQDQKLKLNQKSKLKLLIFLFLSAQRRWWPFKSIQEH